jgi:hypothetical protein
MTLGATEFLRRFFLHVLPRGFVRIRHFGFLANRFLQPIWFYRTEPALSATREGIRKSELEFGTTAR